jgi:hypothetical protein
MPDKPWTCPFCGRNTIIREADELSVRREFSHPLSRGATYRFVAEWKFCPNPQCENFTLQAALASLQLSGTTLITKEVLGRWALVPSSAAKVFPSFIPATILSDYEEACLIVSLSPKASATLSRNDS